MMDAFQAIKIETDSFLHVGEPRLPTSTRRHQRQEDVTKEKAGFYVEYYVTLRPGKHWSHHLSVNPCNVCLL